MESLYVSSRAKSKVTIVPKGSLLQKQACKVLPAFLPRAPSIFLIRNYTPSRRAKKKGKNRAHNKQHRVPFEKRAHARALFRSKAALRRWRTIFSIFGASITTISKLPDDFSAKSHKVLTKRTKNLII